MAVVVRSLLRYWELDCVCVTDRGSVCVVVCVGNRGSVCVRGGV